MTSYKFYWIRWEFYDMVKPQSEDQVFVGCQNKGK